MNQELRKKASDAQKAFSLWKQQMQREGHTKREELDPTTVNPTKFSMTARALWNEYIRAQRNLDQEAYDPSQPILGFFGGEEDFQDPGEQRSVGKVKGKAKSAEAIVHDISERVVANLRQQEVDAPTMADYIKNSSADSLRAAKPKILKTWEIDGEQYAVTGVVDVENMPAIAILDKVVPVGEYRETTRSTFDQDGAGPEGLIAAYKKTKLVICGQDNRLAARTPDPLAQHEEGAIASDSDVQASYASDRQEVQASQEGASAPSEAASVG